MSNRTLYRAFALSCVAGLGLLSPSAHSQLVINATFDSSITSDVNSVAMMNAINEDIQFYQNTYTDSVTVNILFKSDNNVGLGQAATFGDQYSYSDYRAALVSHATTANDALALSHIAAGTNNPVNGNSQIHLTTAHARMLGIDLGTLEFDSTISLNMSLMNLTRTNIDPDKYDLRTVAYHEINEVLGFGSGLNGLPNSPIISHTGPIGTMDLFRYDQNGVRTLTTDPNAQAYFSLDGTTRLERFNQTEGGDRQDWFSDGPHTPSVQDAFSTPGLVLNNGAPELTGLDVIGWTSRGTVVPAPGSLAVFASLFSVGGLSMAARKRRTSRTA